MYKYTLAFKLNKQQAKISTDLLSAYIKGYNIILDAVCGAGKTEMLLKTLEHALNNRKMIGFACPRKQLVIELYQRISKYFDYAGIGLVVGGLNKNIDSNFVFLTTHQLYKYTNYFDLLIIDEVDAFPFYDNYKLEQAALNSSKQFIYLSATVPDKYIDLVKQNKLVYLNNNARHHNKEMPMPKFIKVRYGKGFLILLKLCKQLKYKPLLIFVPTIILGVKINKLLKLFKMNTVFVSGATITPKILEDFRKGTINILISTTVLERGITLKQLNVIVYESDNRIFNKDTLLQISGRVGRDSNYSDGLIYFLGENMSDSVKKTIRSIEKYNEMLNM